MLGDHGAEQWSSTDLAIVRRALCMNVADIGDGYLRLSEWETRQLNWRQPMPGTWSAEASVNNAQQPPAGDTLTVLARLDAGDGRTVHLDDAAWPAWQRLCAEWHAAVYGAQSNDPSTVLNSFAY
ncbi:hypothetical protein [Nocardia tengchongensis]|uniref:hypothetical protein n=2 Tax=Nocardia tengchongensis TaxID=2055889 RepID=UPI0036810DB1